MVTELSRMLIREEIDDNSTVFIDAEPARDELSFRVDRNGGLVDPTTGHVGDILIQVPNGSDRAASSQTVKKIKLDLDVEDDEDMEVL